MDPNPDPTQITHDFPPFFRVHSSGHIERYLQHDFIPPSHDPQTGVVSKDVIISPENNVSARIYLPQTSKPDPKPKLPLIVYIHGGGFTIESAFSSSYHQYLNSMSARSGHAIVSIEYRLAPEHPIPACYDDSWSVLKWVESHTLVRKGSDPWLNDYVDFKRVYLAGDSAGANIAHNMVIRAGNKDYTGDQFGIIIAGLVLIHPFFGNDGGSDKLWNFICPDTTGSSDFRLNPGADMDLLSNMGCKRVLVCVAEKDFLRKRGLIYYETLKKKSDWKGEIELFETPGEEHVFHLFKPGSVNASVLLDRIICFVNQETHMSRV